MDECFCLTCLDSLADQTDLIALFIHDSLICAQCAAKIKVLQQRLKISGCPVYVLYEKNEFLEQVNQRYLQLNDRALARFYLDRLPWQLKKKLRRARCAFISTTEAEFLKKGYDPGREIYEMFQIRPLTLSSAEACGFSSAAFDYLLLWDESSGRQLWPAGSSILLKVCFSCRLTRPGLQKMEHNRGSLYFLYIDYLV